MASEPPAPDLGAIRARLESACEGGQGWAWVSVDDLLALLLVQEAQAARLAAQEPVVEAAERWYDAPGNDTETDEALAAAVLDWKDWQEAEADGAVGESP